MIQNIQAYYAESAWQYRRVWSPLHLHYGYTDHTTKTHADAVLRMTDLVLDAADLQSDLRCLDAGCGVGGTAERAAQRFHVRVDGLTVVPSQVEDAERRLARSGWFTHVGIRTGDYHAIPAPDQFYDRVWFLESFCYAHDIAAVLSEAYRVLKPGGRLVIADGFRKPERYTDDEETLFRQWASCWALQDLATGRAIVDTSANTGFRVVQHTDLTDHVLPSSRRMARTARWTAPWRWFHWGTTWQLANMRGAILQERVLAQGLMRYQLLAFLKP